MADWYLIPWNLQYLGGAVVAMVTTVLVFRGNPKTTSYRCFLAYGMSVVVWMFPVFVARNAPSAASSLAFYKAVLFTFYLVQPLFLLTILQIGIERRIYYLILVPTLFLSALNLIATPFDVFSTNFGWAYSLRGPAVTIGTPIVLSYVAAIIVVLLIATLKSKLIYLKKKYSLMLLGFLLYIVPFTITNITMWRNPNVPPIGGFLLMIEFLFVAYAMSLKPEKIEFAGGRSLDALEDNLFRFVRRLREIMPGKELGRDAAHFDEALQSVGLHDTVQQKSSRQVFDTVFSPHLDIGQTMDRTTGLLRREEWARQASAEYARLFVEVYKRMSQDNAAVANGWLDGMLRRHGGFLDRHGVLAAMPAEVKLPSIFSELRPGKVYFFEEQKPIRAYGKLNRALEYGFDGLCFTKLEPQRVRDTFGAKKAALFWLTFQHTLSEEAVNPQDLERLVSIVSLGTTSSSRTVVLFDCLDQMIIANPSAKVRGCLGTVNKLCGQSAATLVFSHDAEMLKKEHLTAIEEALGEAKQP